jgi:hypothetical protein
MCAWTVLEKTRGVIKNNNNNIIINDKPKMTANE